MVCISISVTTGRESDLYCSFHNRLITWIQLTHTSLKLPLLQSTNLRRTWSLLISSQHWYQHQEERTSSEEGTAGQHWPKTSTCIAQQPRALMFSMWKKSGGSLLLRVRNMMERDAELMYPALSDSWLQSRPALQGWAKWGCSGSQAYLWFCTCTSLDCLWTNELSSVAFTKYLATVNSK